MGNGNSKQEFDKGQIHITFDSQYAIAGEKIKGNICLNLVSEYPAVSLDIVLKGKEKCQWSEKSTTSYTDSNGERQTDETTQHNSDQRSIIKNKFTICVFKSGSIMPGKYKYPFSIYIPHGCPSTSYFAGKNDAIASIKYSIEAILNTDQQSRIKDLVAKRSLIVREMFQHIHNELSSTSQKNIYELCCFFYRGESSLTAKLENYSCSSIENCTVTCDIDNTKCDIPVIKINAILKQHVLLKANSSEYRSELKIGEKSIDGVPTRSMAIGKNKRIIGIPLYEFRNKVNSRNFSDSDFNYEDIHFAQNLQPSSSGINVNISYTITIELEYSTHCSSSPKCIIPLFIHAPDE